MAFGLGKRITVNFVAIDQASTSYRRLLSLPLVVDCFSKAALSILKSDLNNSACAIDLHSPWAMSAGSTYGSYKFNVLQHLTEISPYFEYNSEGLNPDPPQD
ncbi:unnamed protein product [Rotaria socialis]